MARQGNNPKRRILAQASVGRDVLVALAQAVVYVGSANHKRSPGDYGFHPPSNPRAWKSLCDADRVVLKDEAELLLRRGVLRGMISALPEGGWPKYIWSVDARDLPYEAKLGNGGYHGYRLEPDDAMSEIVRREWKQRFDV